MTLVIRSGAGGVPDTMTRKICNVTEKQLAQPIICEDRSGGGRSVGLS